MPTKDAMACTVVSLASADVTGQLDALVAAYLDMFQLPPEAGPRFAAALTEHATRAGFALCAAFDTANGECVGFGYGFTGQPGQAWRDSLAEALGPDLAARWLIDYFEFAEYRVVRSRRREGIGKRLHDTLLGGVPHRHAVLTVRSRQEPARGLYARWGWQALHHDFHTPAGRGPYVIMGRPLPGTASS